MASGEWLACFETLIALPGLRREWDVQERESMLARMLEPLISYTERWALFGALEQHELAQMRLLHANFVELLQTIDDRKGREP